MAQDIKQDIFLYGGLNSDDMPEIISNGDYPIAVDISNTFSGEDNKIGKIIPRKGNELIDNPFYVPFEFINLTPIPLTERKTVGSVRDETTNKIYEFVYELYSIEGTGVVRYWSIYEFDNVNKIISNQVCRITTQIFDQTKYVKWGNVLYGNLFWVQDGIEPKSINIEKAINYTKNQLLEAGVDTFHKPSYKNLTLREFNVIKRPPTALIEAKYGNDADVLTNNIRGKLFQFRYRYIYRDNTESVWSPISKVPLPEDEVGIDGKWSLSENYNYIRLSYWADTVEIKEVQIAKREYDNATGLPSLFEVVHKEEIILPTSDDITETIIAKFYSFYNDVKGYELSEREEDTLYDVVPLSASSMEVISNPNKIVYAGDIVEASSRPNILPEVTLAVTRYSIADATEIEENAPLWETFDASNVRTSLNPYWIEGGTLIKDFHFNRNGAFTAIYIPSGFSGYELLLKLTFTDNGGTTKQYTVNININGLTTQTQIRDKIADSINSDIGANTAFKTKASFESVSLSGAGGFHDTVAQTKWRYSDWAFTTNNPAHAFQGYLPNYDDSAKLDSSVVTIHTGKILTQVGATFTTMRVEKKGVHYSTMFNRAIAREAGNTIGKWILQNNNNIFSSNDFTSPVIAVPDQDVFKFKGIALDSPTTERGVLTTIIKKYDLVIEDDANVTYKVSPTLAPFGEYGVGIVYFDEALRPSYVQECGNSYIERYDSEYDKAIQYRVKMTIKHYAPSWARYWMPVMTENKKMDKFFEVDVSIDLGDSLVVLADDFIKIRVNDAIGADTNSWYSQFGNTLDSLPEYEWTKGDRIVLYDLHNETYLDKEIIKQDDDYIYVENGDSFTDESYVDRLIKIYTPKKTNVTDRYFEVGEINEIITPYILGRHKNNKENIVQGYPNGTLEYLIDFGDVYVNTVNNYKASISGTVWQPTYNEFYRVFYPSKINSYGRIHFPLKTIEEAPYKDRLRISYATVDNANIKGWNKFDYNDKTDVGEQYGKIVGLATMGYTLKVVTELKLISIYINRTVPVNTDGTESIILTDRTIGGISIPEYNYGCKHPESIIKNDRNLYYLNADNGYVIRDSANGQFPINKYKYDSYFNRVCEIIRSDSNIKIYAAFNKDEDEYMLMFNNYLSQSELPISNDFNVVIYNEAKNRWVTHARRKNNSDKIPEWCEFVNNTVMMFLGGQLWLENSSTTNRANYFNRQFIPYIDMFINPDPKKIKTFRGIAIHSTDKWDMRESGDISIPATATYPNGMSSRIKPNKLKNKEGVFYSEFLGDGFSKPIYIDGLINGRQLRGSIMRIRLRNSEVSENSELFSVSVRFNNSEHSY